MFALIGGDKLTLDLLQELFSPREFEVMVLASQGKSQSAIAKEMNVTVGTVKDRFKRSRKKLNKHGLKCNEVLVFLYQQYDLQKPPRAELIFLALNS